jgi:hypothetical protein
MLCDLELFLSIPAIIPMLTIVHDLIVFAQGRDVYINDFMAAEDMSIPDLDCRYVYWEHAYCTLDFPMFMEYVDNKSYLMKDDWLPDMNTGIEYLCFKKVEHSYACHSYDSSGRKVSVTREIFTSTVAEVKAKCTDAEKCLISKLKACFPNTMLLSALGIVYPQFWRKPDAEKHFSEALGYIKKQFGVPRS